MCSEIEDRLPLKDFENYINTNRNALDLMQKDILLKANIKDICTLLDTKAGNLIYFILFFL